MYTRGYVLSQLPDRHATVCVLYTAGDAFRDPTNGCYCDHFAFDGPDPVSHDADQALTGAVCDGQQYSSAATGMGLVATCAFAEMGLLSGAEAERRALQTLESLATLWPREKFSGFFVHFCDRASPMFRPTAEYSTVDTAEMVMGALFAGNYFGGAVQRAAQKLAAEVNWSVAIESATSPTIYPTINAVSPRARTHVQTRARAHTHHTSHICCPPVVTFYPFFLSRYRASICALHRGPQSDS